MFGRFEYELIQKFLGLRVHIIVSIHLTKLNFDFVKLYVTLKQKIKSKCAKSGLVKVKVIANVH